jgi:hypothetical protein
MAQRLLSPSPHPRRASSAGAGRGVLRKATQGKEAQPCSTTAALCRTEARLRHQTPTAERCDLLRSRASRHSTPRGAIRDSSAANDRHDGEPGRTHLPAPCDAHLPTQAPKPALTRTNAASGACRLRGGPAGTPRHPSPQRPPTTSQQKKGNRLAEAQPRPPRPGGPQGAAASGCPSHRVPRHARHLHGGAHPIAGSGEGSRDDRPRRAAEQETAAPASPRRPVGRHARRLHGGAHPIAGAHVGAARGAGVRAVRARSRRRPERAAAAQPQARVRRA